VTANHPIIVGLTGGIATGKSTVARLLSDLGVVVIDADRLAREIVEPGEPALQEIVDAFGEEVLSEEGTLDRAHLGARIFADPDARKRLEAITHPRIAREMFHRAEKARQQGHPFVVYDAALLVETGTHRLLDSLIVVDCSEESQLHRLLHRDDLSPEAARHRIDSQMPLSEKRAVADYVIDNDGSLAQTEAQVRQLKEQLDRYLASRGTTAPPEPNDG
jgi:dephospho-CoA kinase